MYGCAHSAGGAADFLANLSANDWQLPELDGAAETPGWDHELQIGVPVRLLVAACRCLSLLVAACRCLSLLLTFLFFTVVVIPFFLQAPGGSRPAWSPSFLGVIRAPRWGRKTGPTTGAVHRGHDLHPMWRAAPVEVSQKPEYEKKGT